jgi:hypothetical protein
MTATIITLITSAAEIVDQLFGSNLGADVPGVEIFLAAITPLLVWLAPRLPWRLPWDHGPA